MRANDPRHVAPPAPPLAPAPQSDPRPILSSEELFRYGREVRIAHLGQCYTLRLTRENKLILTK